MKEPWRTDKWFTSPWNFVPEVAKENCFAPKVQLHDITLRDGEQQAGLVLRADDKVAIAEKLAEAGVDRIEAGMPAVSRDDEKAIREIVKRKLGPKIFAFARCMVEDVKRAKDCGVDGIVIEIPSSEHIIRNAYGWPPEKAVDLSIKATQAAKEAGLFTTFFTIDASRADLDWLLNLIGRVANEGHMDAVTLVDTMGACSPAAIRYFVRQVRERFPAAQLEAHFHDDFGLATANTLEALALGVQVAHVSVCGIGERAGGAALEDLVVALKTLYGVETGVKTETLYELCQVVLDRTGHQIPANKSVAGRALFDVESGIPATWLRRCGEKLLTEVFPLHPDLMGQSRPRIVLGKGSGDESVRQWLEDMGVEATAEQVSQLTALVKDFSLAKKDLLTRREFATLVRWVLED